MDIIRLMTLAALTQMLAGCAHAEQAPSGYWNANQITPILDKTLEVTLDPDISHLSDGERAALVKLRQAGELFHELFLVQRHPESLSAKAALDKLNTESAAVRESLTALFWMFKGPIATTLDNKREAFLPVSEEWPGKAVYPTAMDQQTLETFVGDDAKLRSKLLHERSVVRGSTSKNLERHRQVLKERPWLEKLNAEFATELKSMRPGNPTYYAVPYAVEYADQLDQIHDLLNQAAADVDRDDPQFANYLRHRARDLFHGDYEAGDAAWVTGRFKNLNAQIGSYETYDDALFGVKAFYSMSILIRDQEKSDLLSKALEHIQDIENSLPYDTPKQVRRNLPVHVSNVLADYGQARGTNTATILPNDADHSRKYGRTILLRNNIMQNPELFKTSQSRFSAAMAPEFHPHLTIEAGFNRTLWHEIGHYLGVDQTADGRDLDFALQQYADLLEEMKSDLVSLFASKKLQEVGIYSKDQLRAIYAGGVLRVLQLVKPRPEQPYQTMQLMQFNYFLENGLLKFDATTNLLSIDYQKYDQVITQLLAETLAVQRAGSTEKARAFVERYINWQDDVHEVIGNRMKDTVKYRYRLVHYPE